MVRYQRVYYIPIFLFMENFLFVCFYSWKASILINHIKTTKHDNQGRFPVFINIQSFLNFKRGGVTHFIFQFFCTKLVSSFFLLFSFFLLQGLEINCIRLIFFFIVIFNFSFLFPFLFLSRKPTGQDLYFHALLHKYCYIIILLYIL